MAPETLFMSILFWHVINKGMKPIFYFLIIFNINALTA